MNIHLTIIMTAIHLAIVIPLFGCKPKPLFDQSNKNVNVPINNVKNEQSTHKDTKVAFDTNTNNENKQNFDHQNDIDLKIKLYGYLDEVDQYIGTPWSEAVTIESNHFKVTSNLRKETIQDACNMLDVIFLKYAKVFKFNRRISKWEVRIAGTFKDFIDMGGSHLYRKGMCTSDGVVTIQYSPPSTITSMLRQVTYLFLLRIAPTCPRWLGSGLATYFEASKFKVNLDKKQIELSTGIINNEALIKIKRSIQAGDYHPMQEFIKGMDGDPNSQGWSFVYYVVHGMGVGFSDDFISFIKDVGKGSSPEKWVEKYLKIDNLSDFESNWKEYILELKIE